MAKISGLTMNNYYGISSSGASTLFGSLSSNGASSIATLSSDYANIKSGAYGKLLKTYYSQDANKLNNNTTSDVKKSEKTDTSQMVLERDSAKELKESASKLTSTDKDSLFAKNDKDSYDIDAIYKGVKEFVDDYNNVVSQASKSNKYSTSNTLNSMTSLTSAMAKNLSKVGITVGVNQKLSINEEAFKKADMNNIKTLFNDNTSYAANVSRSASSIASSAISQIASANGSLYTSSGNYDGIFSPSYNSYF